MLVHRNSQCQYFLVELRGRGRPRRCWMDDIKDWTGLPQADCVKRVHERKQWKELVWLMS